MIKKLDKTAAIDRPGVTLQELIDRGEVDEFYHLRDPEPVLGFRDFVRKKEV